MLFKRKKKAVLSLQIDTTKCLGCENCVERCRRKVFDISYEKGKYFAWVSYPADCVGCGGCLRVCPTGAIELITE